MKHFANDPKGRLILAAGFVVLLGMLAAGYTIHALKDENALLVSQNSALHEQLAAATETNEALSGDLRQLRERIGTLEGVIESERIDRRKLASDYPYQKLYPDLYAKQPALLEKADPHTVYLTFDDGPYPMTDQYLAILKKHGVKATFFVIGRGDAANMARMKRIASDGHALEIHAYQHQYQQIYASVEAYLADFKKINDLIVKATGVAPTIFRFPGGSVNTYNAKTRKAIIAEMTRRGYVYYDWNYSAADSSASATAQSVRGSILTLVGRHGPKVVLLHEGRQPTFEALEGVITELQAKGYRFDKLTNKIAPVQFGSKKTPKTDAKSGDVSL